MLSLLATITCTVSLRRATRGASAFPAWYRATDLLSTTHVARGVDGGGGAGGGGAGGGRAGDNGTGDGGGGGGGDFGGGGGGSGGSGGGVLSNDLVDGSAIDLVI